MNLSQITGFRGKAPIIIKDSVGRNFYVKTKSNKPDGFVYFNLPAGKYITDNVLTKLRRPIVYKVGDLPKPERSKKIPELNIIVAPNPRKCTIYFDSGRIVLDPSMAKLARPNLLHIFFHEVAHYFYITEWKCDLFSCVQMLKRGYNPSQCLKVMMHNLSSSKQQTLERTTRNYKFLKNVKWHL